MKTTLALLAALIALPALARPPDDIAAHRRVVEELAEHAQARAATRELSQMRSWIEEAAAAWRRGDRDALARTFTRLEAQAELVRARMQAAAARAALARTEEDLANVRHQVEAERRRYEATRAFLEGGQ